MGTEFSSFKSMNALPGPPLCQLLLLLLFQSDLCCLDNLISYRLFFFYILASNAHFLPLIPPSLWAFGLVDVFPLALQTLTPLFIHHLQRLVPVLKSLPLRRSLVERKTSTSVSKPLDFACLSWMGSCVE